MLLSKRIHFCYIHCLFHVAVQLQKKMRFQPCAHGICVCGPDPKHVSWDNFQVPLICFK